MSNSNNADVSALSFNFIETMLIAYALKFSSDLLTVSLRKHVDLYTVGCRYDVVQYYMILRTSLKWLRLNIHHIFNLQKTPHFCPNGRTMGCLCWEFLVKIDHVITPPHCSKHTAPSLHHRTSFYHFSDNNTKYILKQPPPLNPYHYLEDNSCFKTALYKIMGYKNVPRHARRLLNHTD